jgi:predicted ATPase
MTVSPRLDFITVKGFRSIASLRKLSIRPINVLIGANGSGKSNFLRVFELVRAVCQGNLLEYVRRAGGAEQLLYFGSKTTGALEIQLSFGGQQYQLLLKPTDDDNLYPGTATRNLTNGQDSSHPGNPALSLHSARGEPGRGGRPWRNLDELQRHAEDWRIYHLNDTTASAPVKKTAQLNDNSYLRPDGSNLAAFLYLLKKKHAESYGVIRDTVRQVAPFFDDFELKPDPLNEETIRLAWKHRISDQYFGVSALSDGTLRFIVLTTLLLQPDQLLPSTILIDEPELGLHPYAIALLASLVKQASVKAQLILSTQSSLLLDRFEPEDVLVAERSRGATEIKRLKAAPLKSWLEDYSLGQLWEKNELGGRPRHD